MESTSEENIEANHVIRTDPEIDTEVPVGSSVTVYVSMGIAVEEADVPNLVGMSLEAATKECKHRNLKIETEEKASDKEKDQVIEQDPETGKIVAAGSTIKLTISNGEEPEGEVNYGLVNLPAGMSGMYTLSFTTDEEGVIASRQFVAESLTDASVSVKVSGKGKRTVKVSVTGAQSGKTAVVGTYTFDFANKTFTASSENVEGAFDEVMVKTTLATTQEPAETQVTTAAAEG